jgi:outer membrane immunogenic protein
MKNTLLATVAVLAFTASTALAADVEEVLPPEEPDWAGLYVGVHAGYGRGDRDGCFDVGLIVAPDDCSDGTDFDYDQKGWLAGGQVGYNFMVADSFLLGVEVDASLASIDGELDDLGLNKTGVGEYEWLSTAKVRAGWAFTDDFLIFATGGLALAGFNFEANSGCEFDQTRDGWMAGGGAELKISPRASIKAEYNFMDLGKEEQPCSALGGLLPIHTEADAELHVIKFGLNYLIGGP